MKRSANARALWIFASLLIACGGGSTAKGPLRVVFGSNRRLDGSDALNSNDPSNVYGTYNIWRVNADGTDLTPITHATAERVYSGAPQWSPDGSKLVFISNRKLDGSDAFEPHDNYNIWLVNADGTGLVPLTRGTAERVNCWPPSFSR